MEATSRSFSSSVSALIDRQQQQQQQDKVWTGLGGLAVDGQAAGHLS